VIFALSNLILSPYLTSALLTLIKFFIKIFEVYVLNVSIFSKVFVLMTLKLYSLLGTWLNDSVYNRKLFLDDHFVFRADRDYTDSKLTRGGGVLASVHRSFSSCKRMV
jgi:hypothetical protein